MTCAERSAAGAAHCPHMDTGRSTATWRHTTPHDATTKGEDGSSPDSETSRDKRTCHEGAVPAALRVHLLTQPGLVCPHEDHAHHWWGGGRVEPGRAARRGADVRTAPQTAVRATSGPTPPPSSRRLSEGETAGTRSGTRGETAEADIQGGEDVPSRGCSSTTRTDTRTDMRTDMRTDRRIDGNTRPSVPSQTGKPQRRSHRTGEQPGEVVTDDRCSGVWPRAWGEGEGGEDPRSQNSLSSTSHSTGSTDDRVCSHAVQHPAHGLSPRLSPFPKLPEVVFLSGRGALGSPWADPTAEPAWPTRQSPLPRGSTAGPHEARGPSWGEDSCPWSFLGRRSPWSPPGETTGTKRGSHPTRMWQERNEGLHAFTAPETGSTFRTFQHDSNPLSLQGPFCHRPLFIAQVLAGLRPPPLTPCRDHGRLRRGPEWDVLTGRALRAPGHGLQARRGSRS